MAPTEITAGSKLCFHVWHNYVFVLFVSSELRLRLLVLSSSFASKVSLVSHPEPPTARTMPARWQATNSS
jgi:hypothetical protein